jgi:hypothetical protein
MLRGAGGLRAPRWRARAAAAHLASLLARSALPGAPAASAVAESLLLQLQEDTRREARAAAAVAGAALLDAQLAAVQPRLVIALLVRSCVLLRVLSCANA